MIIITRYHKSDGNQQQASCCILTSARMIPDVCTKKGNCGSFALLSIAGRPNHANITSHSTWENLEFSDGTMDTQVDAVASFWFPTISQ